MTEEKTVSAEAKQEHSRQELLKRYMECMRAVLRNQQEAYFSLVGLLCMDSESAKMSKFYFTYGTGGQPFYGGWTEIEAPDKQTAYSAFEAFHPKSEGGCLPFCECYTEEQFAASGMNGSEGNFGRRCHERICLTRELCGKEDVK